MTGYKMNKSSILIALSFLITGFVSSYFIFSDSANNKNYKVNSGNSTKPNDSVIFKNPFAENPIDNSNAARFENLENEIIQLKEHLQKIETSLADLSNTMQSNSALSTPISTSKRRQASALTQRLYSLESLLRGGIDPTIAEDIVRRKNSVELKRLELQDIATRGNYLNTQQYYDELDVINNQDVSLRDELGDEQYDEYLFNSRQNNRIKISSVMLGSSAEEAGIQKGDIVLSYDDSRMFTWTELKDATAQGELGEYVSISIYRDGEIFSFSVPRGPLGTQLGATRLTP